MELETMVLQKEGSLAVITFNRAETMNVCNVPFLADLRQAADSIEADERIKAVILWGGPRVFASGGDIEYMMTADPGEMESFISGCHRTFNRIADSPKPYVAAIAGMALGIGLEAALACDIRIASENAVLGLPEINLVVC